MIKFPCHCGHNFGLENDQAGGTIQCPKCGRLNDIPTLSDLEHIESDGIYKLDAPADAPQQAPSSAPGVLPYQEKPDAIERLRRAFGKETVDQAGEDIDLRPTIDDIRKVGDIEIPLALHDEVLPGAPKYDPETGELIKPHDLNKSEYVDPKTIPTAQRAMSYATPELHQTFAAGRALLMLFQPINLLVMGFVLFAHAMLLLVALILAYGLFLIAPLFILIFALLLAHYGILIDAIGPGTHNELPRPLRDLDWHDDLWGPFSHVFGSMIIAYAPAILAWALLHFDDPLRFPLIIVGLCIGTVFFPAICLTATTSGTMINLRPDRVFGVMYTCGGRYIVAMLLWPITVALYLYGLAATTFLTIRQFLPSAPKIPWYFDPPLAVIGMLGGIYLAHYFCVYLGLLYRAHHDAFPWAFQRHIPTKLLDRLKSKEDAADESPKPRGPRDPRQRMAELHRDPRNQRRQPES